MNLSSWKTIVAPRETGWKEGRHNVIVDMATACATMATHWVCGEFDAELCGDVKTFVLRGIRGQNRLSIFCPLVHVLPTASYGCHNLKLWFGTKFRAHIQTSFSYVGHRAVPRWFGAPPKTQEGAPFETLKFAHFCNWLK